MGWIERLRSKSDEQKRKILWSVVLIALVVLILIWIIIGNYKPSQGSDNSFFKSIRDAFKNSKNIKIDTQQ